MKRSRADRPELEMTPEYRLMEMLPMVAFAQIGRRCIGPDQQHSADQPPDDAAAVLDTLDNAATAQKKS
ncbi:MAG: hypothetical protein ACLU3I_04175 [Acutalibacteraceae bacterium]